MITYEVPLKTYPDTYNKQPLMYAALASQKNHMAVYLVAIYVDENDRKNSNRTIRKPASASMSAARACDSKKSKICRLH
jgi:hypothetical protein